MKKRNYKSPLLLTITAVIWGFAFVAQSVGMEYVGPFTFICIRNLIGALVLLPVIRLMGKLEKSQKSMPEAKQMTQKEERRTLLKGGICCGLILFLSSSAQQIGIQYTTVGKAGFITAIYIILVPVFSLFLGKKCDVLVWISVLLAMVGFYFLTMIGETGFTKGDGYVLLCACMFSWHILCVDYFAPKVDGVKLACLQFMTCGLVSGIAMIILEKPHLMDIAQAWAPILYAGALSCGVAYTLQIIGQKDFHPTIAALIMSLESVFSLLAGWLILHQALSATEAIGCILIFAGIILAQLPRKQHKA